MTSESPNVTPKGQIALADSCHALIAELWLGALYFGFTKHDPKRANPQKLIWPFLDKAIPLPNESTAAFWVYACEDGLRSDPDSNSFFFVPPISTPLQIENIDDAGIDSFLYPSTHVVDRNMRRHIGTQLRSDMSQMLSHTDDYMPIATWESNQLLISSGHAVNQSSVSINIEQVWRERFLLGTHIATPIGLPNCPDRLINIAGTHLRHLTHYGLGVRGERWNGVDFANGENVRLNELATTISIPPFTAPLWFGFRITKEGPPKALFEWCRAYMRVRSYGIKCLRGEVDHVGYEYDSYYKRLKLGGHIVQQKRKEKKGDKLESKRQRFLDSNKPIQTIEL